METDSASTRISEATRWNLTQFMDENDAEEMENGTCEEYAHDNV